MLKIEQLPVFEPKLTAQEVLDLSANPQRLALAKDWSVITQKLDWLMERMRDTSNIVAQDHEIVAEIALNRRAFHRLKVFVVSLFGIPAGLYYLVLLLKLLKIIP